MNLLAEIEQIAWDEVMSLETRQNALADLYDVADDQERAQIEGYQEMIAMRILARRASAQHSAQAGRPGR